MRTAAALAGMALYALGTVAWFAWFTRAADHAGDPARGTRAAHLALGAPLWPLLAPALLAAALAGRTRFSPLNRP